MTMRKTPAAPTTATPATPAPRPTRRRFLQNTTYAGITFLFTPGIARTYAANEKLVMACVGAGGQATGGVYTALGQHLVAIAEVDPDGRGKGSLSKVHEQQPDAKLYTDYRQLFDKHPKLDAVWVATPDHNHFGASLRAMEAGAGVYCEKPLTWSVWEARKLREVSNAKKLPTQMGNQGHSSDSIRLICEYIWAGTLGDVKDVACICNRRFSAGKRPESKPVPAGLDWQAWIGPAPFRDFHDGLHPFNWRGWLDFGTGSLGDMACHTVDGAVWGLKLNTVDSFEVEAELGKPTEEGYPAEAVIVYKFPARGDMPPVTLTWYHGGKKPPRPAALDENQPIQGEGTYYIGSKASMMSGSHCQDTRLLPAALAASTPKPPQVIPRSKHGHGGDFIEACKDRSGPLPSSNFDYASRLTEIVLAGNLACLSGEKLTYSMKEGKTNSDKANARLKRRPREGWTHGYEG
jgi:predicted dehydrogenase